MGFVFVECMQLPCPEDTCLILLLALEQEGDLRYQKTYVSSKEYVVTEMFPETCSSLILKDYRCSS